MVFRKPIHKILFDIQNKPFFEWPTPMGGNLAARDKKLRFHTIRILVT